MVIIETTTGRLEDEIYKLNASGYTVVKTEYAEGKHILTAQKVNVYRASDKILKDNSINGSQSKRRTFEFLTKIMNRKSKDI